MRKFMVAALAAVALAPGAPAALADDPVYGCSYRSVQQDDVTGQNVEGVIVGYVVHAGDSRATIRCFVTVNGREAASTPTGNGFTVGRVSYAANDTDAVVLYAEYCTTHGCARQEYETERTQIPPQEVIDLGNELYAVAYKVVLEVLLAVFDVVGPIVHSTGPIFIDVLDPTLCPFFAALTPGIPGVVNIDSEGDIDLFGDPYYDCPPYDIHH